jgi:hypothetical protein
MQADGAMQEVFATLLDELTRQPVLRGMPVIGAPAQPDRRVADRAEHGLAAGNREAAVGRRAQAADTFGKWQRRDQIKVHGAASWLADMARA